MNTYVVLQEISWPVVSKQTRLATPRGKSKTCNHFGNKSSKCSTVQNDHDFPIVRNPPYLLQVLAKQNKGSQPAQVIFSSGSPLKVVSKY